MNSLPQRPSFLFRLFTISRWLPGYTSSFFRSDLLAGVTVGVMLIPQSMAYAMLAGVPPVYGLYASLVPLLVYPLFGTSRQLAGGVIAIDMLIVAAGLSGMAVTGSQHYIELAILLAFMVGAVQIVMGLGRLGFIVNLLSRPIITGFASGAALIIAFSQFGSLMGLQVPGSSSLHKLIPSIFGMIGETHRLTFGIGLAALALLLFIKDRMPRVPGPLLVAVLGTLVAWLFALDQQGLHIVGPIKKGLPMPVIPHFSFTEVGKLSVTAFTLALVQFMTVVTLGKVFSAKHRYSIRPNRELFAMGVSNLAGSFFRSIPVSGSFSRTVVNDAAGAKTPLANVFAAVLVGLTLLLFMPLVEYLPITILSSIIIVSAFGLFDIKTMQQLWRLKRIDGVISVVTFGATIFVGIQYGIIIGIVLSVTAIMYRISVPNVAELGHVPGTRSFRDIHRNPSARVFQGVLILRIDASFSFANAEFLKSLLDTRTRRDESVRDVVIDANSINDLDTTAAAALVTSAELLEMRGVGLYFGGAKKNVEEMMRETGLIARLGADHFHMSPFRAVAAILRSRGEYEKYFGATTSGQPVGSVRDE